MFGRWQEVMLAPSHLFPGKLSALLPTGEYMLISFGPLPLVEKVIVHYVGRDTFEIEGQT